MSQTVLFLCPHGAAKSVVASALFKQAMDRRGLQVDVACAGTEPDDHVSPVAVDLLRGEGIDVSAHRPQKVTPDALQRAHHIVSLGCDLGDLIDASRTVERWDQVPAVSADPSGALRAIRAHVEKLVADLTGS